ncbi:unnamed protein product [Phytophthora lilii]|uniref:Unnamed protein product n=1 Tax=Phytophthora lilii TaxID=2077276 RepID=A0A9W6YJ38_9STRA|nr:unnamed protein product [Phytophthora lilii]
MKVLAPVAVFASSLLLAPHGASAACSSWSSLYQDVLDGVCVCNETQCDSIVSDYTKLTEGQVGVYTTSKAGDRLTYTVAKVDETPVDEPTFSIDVTTQYQTMLGFGGGFTDSAAINLYKLSPKLQEMALDQYFGKTGLQYNLNRVPIGSTDFSTSTYTYNEMADDFEMTNFTIASDKAPHSNKLDMIHRALNMTDMKLFASSWAPPLWMTNGDSVVDCTIKGKPGEKYWAALALYYSKFFDAYKEEGIDFWAMTVQNEPEKPPLAVSQWQTLRLTAEEERDFIKLNLGPLMAKNHPEVKIMANDDQKPGIMDRTAPFDDPESKKIPQWACFPLVPEP